jgi:small-conductance mechanosensitive channel
MVAELWNTTVVRNCFLVMATFGIVWGVTKIALFLAAQWLTRKNLNPAHVSIRNHFTASFSFLVFFITSSLVLSLYLMPPHWEDMLSRAVNVLLTFGATWFALKVVTFGEQALYTKFDTSASDNFSQRKARTKLQYITRMVLIAICFFGLATILLSFPWARKFGASLIASAGLASVVIGFAAQKSLSNVIAGFQIAFTQPIRIDDVVIVEKEWGRIEEINLTYVVVKLWDLRRLVLPITYFVEKPFENWTRTSAKLLGYSMLYVDFEAPVEELRAEFKRIVQKSPLWDKQVCVLQVTDLKAQVMELRALVSANNASEAFDLRCLIREEMVAYIRKNCPQALPRTRVADTDDYSEGLRPKVSVKTTSGVPVSG